MILSAMGFSVGHKKYNSKGKALNAEKVNRRIHLAAMKIQVGGEQCSAEAGLQI